MTTDKKTESTARVPATAAGAKGRKPWVPKSPVETILEQIAKQEKKVAEMQQALDTEKAMLNKLLQFKKGLES